MNFGQHWRDESVENIPYSVELPKQLAIDIINWQLPEYVQDAQDYPEDHSLLEQLLKENDWNTNASWLLKQGPELLRQMLLEEYAHEMMLQWFGDGNLEQDGYILNSCKEVELAGDVLKIRGFCRKTGTTSAYQDF